MTECLFSVSLTGESCDTKMVVKNTGKDDWDFQAALHSYFDISSISKTSIGGSFKGATFLNKVCGMGSCQLCGQPQTTHDSVA